MKYFSMLIKPASSLCNMKCSYCFYADVSDHREVKTHGIMDQKTMRELIEKTLYAFDEEVMITYAFQGGEPTLAGLEFFEQFVECVNSMKKEIHHVFYALQTNGLLLDDEWITFLKKHEFLVGVSLDGMIAHHDDLRKDAQNKPTYERIMKNIRKLKEEEVQFNVLTVLTHSLSKKAKQLYAFYKKNQLNYVQLIPCLPSLDFKDNPFALKPHDFAHFYDEFFSLWYKDWKKNEVMSVTLFDNLIPMFAGIPPQQCGYLGFCSMQFVTESDGSVYPCDFYVLDEHCLGNIKTHSIKELATSVVLKSFLSEKRNRTRACLSCRYEGICHGQCKRMSVCYYDETYCGLKEFMTKHEKAMLEVASSIQRR